MKKVGAYLFKCLLAYIAFVVITVVLHPQLEFLNTLKEAGIFLAGMVLAEALAWAVRAIIRKYKAAQEAKAVREAEREAKEAERATKKEEKEAKKAEKQAKKAEKEAKKAEKAEEKKAEEEVEEPSEAAEDQE